jgi:hypothetical protein
MRLCILASIAAVAVLGGRLSAAAAHPAPHEVPAPPFSWPGVYDLMGTQFPEGSRRAVLTVERADSAYRVSIDGPPGRVFVTWFSRDSAHVTWSFEDGSLMFLDLRGVGDSVRGRWQMGEAGGPLLGRRRR